MQFDLLQNDLFTADDAPAIESHKVRPARPRKSAAEILSELESLDPQELLAPLPDEIMDALRPVSEGQHDEHEPEFDDQEVVLSQSDKSPDALKTISEAAQVLEVPQHVLRFWESRFPQVKPVKSRGGRRYYRPEDMKVLETIKHLLYKEGYTIKGAKKAFQQARQSEVQVVAPAEPPALSMEQALQTLENRAVFTEGQLREISALRQELVGLRDTLKNYL